MASNQEHPSPTIRNQQKVSRRRRGDEGREEKSGFVSIEGCDNFFENTGERPITKTVTICNDDVFDMEVDIDGKKITTIPEKKCKTIIVTIPKNKSLHVDRNGRYRPEPS
jgi:hypothetical protein